MSLRKIAVLLAAGGLAVGLVGGGVGANFTDQVKAIQNINVGTFSCIISATGSGVTLGDYVNGYPHSVTYNAPTIESSAPSSSPFSFTVQNTGSIGAVLNVSTTGVSAPFSIVNAPFSPQPLAASASLTYVTGIQWGPLNNSNLGQSVTATWTVACDESPGTGAVIFDNTPPGAITGNFPSVGPEAYSFAEFGGGATFAGSARNLSTATVTLSSWACQTGSWTDGSCASSPGATFDVPITFNVYNVGTGNAVGTLIATKTQTFSIPYRPAWDAAHCLANGNYHPWYNGTTCSNGKAVDITFAFSGQPLPNTAIFGIAFNTDHYGYSPLGGTNSPTDSLNIAMYPGTGDGTVATTPSVGAFLPDGLSAYLNDSYGSQYLDNGAGGTHTFRLDTGPKLASGPIGPYGGYEPAIQITAN